MDHLLSLDDFSSIEFQKSNINITIYYIGWISSLFSIILSFGFFILFIPYAELSYSIPTIFSSIFGFFMIKYLIKSRIIKTELRRRLIIINIIITILALAFNIYSVSNYILTTTSVPRLIRLFLSIELSILFVYGLFRRFRKRLISISPKLYFKVISYIWLLFSISTGGLFSVVFGEMLILLSNLVFQVTLTVLIFTLMAIKSVNYLKDCNKFLHTSTSRLRGIPD